MNEILLKGCAATPMAHYLKALGVLRLVTEQKDKKARGAWCEDGFILKTALDKEELFHFFLEEYAPTPLFAPWNGGSGFYSEEGKGSTATKTLDTVLAAGAERMKPSIEAALSLKAILNELNITETPKDQKPQFIMLLRSRMNDRYLEALDSCVVLTDEKPQFPPIFGSGGNDGRLDFTSNFYQQILRLMDTETGKSRPVSGTELNNSLFSDTISESASGAIGQFAPGIAGGPNATTGFDGGSGVNGWDYILMLEGALLFAASISRRLESSDRATLSFPFTVRTTGSGAGNAATTDEGNSRNEIWMPLWHRFTSLQELKFLLQEGRASLGKRNCHDGLDFARSVALLGTDRGITAFQRFGFFMRSGKAYHATPIGRVAVHHNPDANLITDLEKSRWLDNLRRTARAKEASSALQNAVHSLENQLFDLTRHPTASVIQRLIIGIGNIGRTQAVSGKLRENLSFLPEMDSRWLEKAQSPDAAFRIATALSSIGGGKAPMMRSHIYPLDGGSGWKLNKEGKNPLCTFSHADLTTELCRMAERRHLAARQGKIAFSLKGSSPVNEEVLAAFLADPDMDTRILALLPGLCLIKKHFPLKAADTEQNTHRPPLAYRLLKPFFCDHGDLVSAGILQEDIRLPLDAEIIRYLSTDQVERAIQTATRRLRIAGLQIPKHLPDCGSLNGKRLLAALMIPIYPATLKALTQTALSAAETA